MSAPYHALNDWETIGWADMTSLVTELWTVPIREAHIKVCSWAFYDISNICGVLNFNIFPKKNFKMKQRIVQPPEMFPSKDQNRVKNEIDNYGTTSSQNRVVSRCKKKYSKSQMMTISIPVKRRAHSTVRTPTPTPPPKHTPTHFEEEEKNPHTHKKKKKSKKY